MYIRSKIIKGNTYYQVVEGRREGSRVRQRVVVALGRHPTIAAALPALRRELSRLRRERRRLDVPEPGQTRAARLARLDRSIVALAAKIKLLLSIQKNIKVGTTVPGGVVPTDLIPSGTNAEGIIGATGD